jgi:hypothetical protein
MLWVDPIFILEHQFQPFETVYRTRSAPYTGLKAVSANCNSATAGSYVGRAKWTWRDKEQWC